MRVRLLHDRLRQILARSTLSQNAWALKAVSAEALGGLEVARFLRAIRRSARLLHPHVLPVLDAGEAGGRPYLVTPWVEGGSLRELLAPDLGRAAPGLPAPVCRVVAEAMSVQRDHRPATPARLVERLTLALAPSGGPAATATIARSVTTAMARWAVGHTRPRPRGSPMESLLEDLRFSLRALRRKPLFAAVAILTLALGIGANSAMFSVIHAAVLSPLPYPAPERLVRLFSTFEGRPCCVISVPNFLDMRPQVTRFEDLVAYQPVALNLTGEGDPVRLSGYGVTWGFFELLGATPQVGRLLDEDDDAAGAEPVAVLSDRTWRDLFGADPRVVGRSVLLESVPHTVVGVAPPGFRVTGQPQIFVPFAWDPGNLPSRGSNSLIVLGRVADGASREAAMDELASIYGELVRQYPDAIVNDGVAALPLDEWLVGASRQRPLLILWGAVGMVLLVACANVVNLMLARAETRQREIAVRAALGAGRGRLVRHFLSESLLVALAGAGLGVLGAWVGLRVLMASFGEAVPRGQEVAMSPEVLGFTLLVALACALVVGVVPALQLGGRRLQAALREGGRGAAGRQSRLRKGLVVLEVGAALVLVVGAGLMLKSFWRLQQVDVGVDPGRLLTVRISLSQARYGDAPARVAFAEGFLEELRRLPEVEEAGMTSATPFSGTWNNYSRILPAGEPDRVATFVESRMASPGLFPALGLRLVQGRGFERSDGADAAPVVIVNRELARRLFPDGDAVGREIGTDAASPAWRVVGVVDDLREHGPDRAVPPTMYFPHLQRMPGTLSLVARTGGDPLGLVDDVRRIGRTLDAELPLYGIARLDQLIHDGLGGRRLSMSLLSVFAGLALLLGSLGIYGVMAYTVEQRTREIGLRQALGATPRTVLGLVVGQGVRLAGVGIVLGIGGAVMLRETLATLLYEVSTLDPAVYGAVAVTLAVVAAVACVVPARRAAAVHPMAALREE